MNKENHIITYYSCEKIRMEEVLEDASEDWKWVFEVPESETHILGAGNLLALWVPVFNTAFFWKDRCFTCSEVRGQVWQVYYQTFFRI